jgi:glutamate-1-semialdehyde 2,1-aminomutase
MNFEKGQTLQNQLCQLVPGGSHTYSKGMDQFPVNAPGLIERGRGGYCWDVDGNQFIDYGMGLRSVGVGHADPEINEAVIAAMANGTNFTRPSTLELQLAEEYTQLIPSMEMVKFAKNGSDATSASIRLARAYTGRKHIAVCSDHPFFSVNDWFIGKTPCDSGVPREVQDLTLGFRYNDIESVKALVDHYKIAAFILEPLKVEEPQNNFLEELEKICRQHGALLIYDEMISGFRWDMAGAQKHVGIVPDLTTFGKATANGFSLSVLGGRKEIMELGGLTHNKERVFLLSQTHGAESTGLAASLKNIEIYKRDGVIEHHWSYGQKLIDGTKQITTSLGVNDFFSIEGYACSPIIKAKNQTGQVDLRFYTLYSQEMIQSGVLMPWIAFCRDHGEEELKITLEAIEKTMKVYKKALDEGIENYLVGPATKPVWRKFNVCSQSCF